jgi:CheY-like chemotaxis protein
VSLSLFAPSASVEGKETRPRRVLIVVDAGESVLSPLLARHGYVTETASLTSAPWLIKSNASDLVILELYQGPLGGNAESLYLARSLRAEPETYATPLVIAWSEEQEQLRRSALYMGADDYFALDTPVEKILARFDSLFWRIESGRRNATLIGDQKLEIENFVLLTDAIRWDIERAWEGTLALAQPLNRDGQPSLDRAGIASALNSMYGFLKLQMRRIDSVVFYDAGTLLIYLPHLMTPIAIGALTRLRGEYLEAQKSGDMAVGLVSFPTDGNNLEDLLEMAATAALQARSGSEFRRVVAYGFNRAEIAPKNETATEPVISEEPPEPEDEPELLGATEPEEVIEPITGPEEIVETVAEPPELVRNSPVLTEKEMPLPPEFNPNLQRPPVPLPPSPFSADETFNAPEPEPPAFFTSELELPPPQVGENGAAARGATAQDIEKSLRPAQNSRLLLAVSRPERMAQLNTLARSAGYEVRPAFDGPHALGLLRIDPPDLLLLDYEVRGLNGLETLHRIQAQHNGRLPIPVILLSAPLSPEIKTEAEALGVEKVINLPYSPIELLAAMRQAVSKN